MTFTAIIPLNHGRPRKTRLSAILSEAERDALAMAMAHQVVEALAASSSVTALHLLSPLDPAIPGTRWIADGGTGLNAELAAARAALGEAPILFIHADLPLLEADDIEALLAAARENGVAIAPDAAGIGTNALAIADGRSLAPAFGHDSFARHRVLLPGAMPVERPGLRHDVDDPDSLAAAMALGFTLPFPSTLVAPDRIAPSI